MKKIIDSKFIKKYKERMISSIKSIDNDIDEERLNNIINKEITDKIQIPMLYLNNNYTGENKDASLLSVLDWIMTSNTIKAGNGTFYKPHYEALNPNGVMLDTILLDRKADKKALFKVEDNTSYEYIRLDRSQLNHKINANSYYGASGLKSSAFYSEYSGPATTLTAQQIIATTENTFEAFVHDNYQFLDLNELFDWLYEINNNLPEEIDDWLTKIDRDVLIDRLYNKILNHKDMDKTIISNYVNRLSSKMVSYIYYKNNLIEFIKDHDNMIKLYKKVFRDVLNLSYITDIKEINEYKEKYNGIIDFSNISSVKEMNNYINKLFFMDPNDVPFNIKNTIEEFNKYLVKYVYCRYLPFDRIYRLRNFKRKVVMVIDTDSNILALDDWVKFAKSYILEDNDYGRNTMNNDFIIINSITYTLTDITKDILKTYCIASNIPDDYHRYINMKNEFFFSLLAIGTAKKRYISKIILREGNLLSKPKIDVKGFDFIKSTTSKESEEFFMGVIKRRIIDGEIDTMGMLNDLKEYGNSIRDSLLRGELKYLPIINVKDLSAYKNPKSMQAVKAYLLWDMINPDKEIELPSKPKLLSLLISDETDLARIKDTFPNEYSIIMDKVFNDNSGYFVESKTANGKTVIKKKGIKVLAIPSNLEIPKWCMEFIDYDTMVNKILAPFLPVLKIFGIHEVNVGKSKGNIDRKSKKITNIIKF